MLFFPIDQWALNPFLKGTMTQNIFSLKTSPNDFIDLWNNSGLQK